MIHLKYFFAAILLAIFANAAPAQSIKWATTDDKGNQATYPQTGTVNTSITDRCARR